MKYIKHMYKLISFDGDGTLWYPKKTKLSKDPHRVYEKYGEDSDAINRELVVIPEMLELLERLQDNGIKTILISANPNIKKIADIQTKERATYLEISDLFDDVYSSSMQENAKGELLKDIAKQRGYELTEILHVGDSYSADYQSAKNAGVDALLLKTAYNQAEKYDIEKSKWLELEKLIQNIKDHTL